MRPFLLSVGCMLWLVILTAESGPLDRPLRGRFLGATSVSVPLAPGNLPEVLPRVLSGARIPLGIEGAVGLGPGAGVGHRYVHLAGRTVREALDSLVSLSSVHEWREVDQAVVVRPREMWGISLGPRQDSSNWRDSRAARLAPPGRCRSRSEGGPC